MTVMQPAIMPAMAQATATVMAPLAPAARASMAERMVDFTVDKIAFFTPIVRMFSNSLWTKPMTKAAKMDRAAEKAMVFAPEDTSQTSRIKGRIR